MERTIRLRIAVGIDVSMRAVVETPPLHPYANWQEAGEPKQSLGRRARRPGSFSFLYLAKIAAVRVTPVYIRK